MKVTSFMILGFPPIEGPRKEMENDVTEEVRCRMRHESVGPDDYSLNEHQNPTAAEKIESGPLEKRPNQKTGTAGTRIVRRSAECSRTSWQSIV